MPEHRIVPWTVQIAQALQYIHSQRILHRDLKCANIFLAKGDIVKVGDFGTAAQLEHTLEMKNTCVGTPYFMSPEVCLITSQRCHSPLKSLTADGTHR